MSKKLPQIWKSKCMAEACFPEPIDLQLHGRSAENVGLRLLRIYLVAYRVCMLHFALKHYAAGFKAPMRVVWEASCCEMCRSLQLVQHEIGIQISQCRRAYRPADGHTSTVRYVCASNDLQKAEELISAALVASTQAGTRQHSC